MENDTRSKIVSLSDLLEQKKNTPLNMLMGLDGFVDEILHVVDKRQDFNNFTRVKYIKDFGERILKASGLSANIEFVAKQVKLGGNGPILSNALIQYGVDLTYIGALGNPDIHPVFKPMAEKCTVYSLSNPGHTDALEFEDGKLMLGKHSDLKALTWERFKEVVGGPLKIAEMINKCDLFGMENWTMIPFMSEIWKGLIDEVFPLLGDRKPIAFFDLADPEKRTKEDILEAMELIAKFEDKFNVILGLNEKEAHEIAEVFGVDKSEDLPETVKTLYSKLNIYCLVVHPTKEAMCCINGRFYRAEGPYCPNPVLTTGAGDNFNAGFCMGAALRLDPEDALLMGVASSGYYVRNGGSASFDDLIKLLRDWAEDKI